MLWQKVIGAVARRLQFVGGVGLSSASTQTPSFSLTGLSGGLAASPAPGDIVIVAVSFKDNTDRNIQCTTSGYTEVADLYYNAATNDSQLGVYYKVLSLAETSVAFNLGVNVASFLACHVWRNINATPLDATTTTTESRSPPNPASITTTTDNAVVIAIGGGAAGGGTIGTITAPTGMENLFSASSSSVAGIGIASILIASPQTYDPAAFGGFSASTSDGACSATLALRAA